MSVEKSHRLPDTVIPVRYELKLTPDLSAWTFAGEEKVTLQVREAVREIILNAAELELQSVSLETAAGKILPGHAAFDSANPTRGVWFFGGGGGAARAA